jgi:hypothetical protein
LDLVLQSAESQNRKISMQVVKIDPFQTILSFIKANAVSRATCDVRSVASGMTHELSQIYLPSKFVLSPLGIVRSSSLPLQQWDQLQTSLPIQAWEMMSERRGKMQGSYPSRIRKQL